MKCQRCAQQEIVMKNLNSEFKQKKGKTFVYSVDLLFCCSFLVVLVDHWTKVTIELKLRARSDVNRYTYDLFSI